MNGSSMWEAPFVNTFQNKDNLLIYTNKISKCSYQMQRNVIASFCTFIFLSISQQRSFFIHFIICVSCS